jgi:hypothetical protein
MILQDIKEQSKSITETTHPNPIKIRGSKTSLVKNKVQTTTEHKIKETIPKPNKTLSVLDKWCFA